MPAYVPGDVYAEHTTTCVSAGVPLLKKMKVLKKFKRKIGLAGGRSDSSNLPPLQFHQICGDNVRIENNGKIARRVESFCKGVVFSNRPVKVGERVCIKLAEISVNWSGVIRFGFTSQDPVGLRDALPKYVCPDLTNKPGYWAKALSERFAEEGLVLFYHVTSTGDVHFGINGEEKGVFFSGVETRCPLWVMVDVYGNSTAVEFLDPLAQLNNRVRIVNDLRPNTTASQSRVINQSSGSRTHPSRESPPSSHPQPRNDVVEHLQPSMAQLGLTVNSPISQRSGVFSPFPFHRVKGRNVNFNHDNTIASRIPSEYSHGYVFGCRPIKPGEYFTIQVLHTDPIYVGALAFGLTAANPAGLDASDLPEDCDLLLDRPEYWVVSKDVASTPLLGDELSFGLTSNGEVVYCKMGSPARIIMHVDHSLQLWPFFDIYGNTTKIRSFGILQGILQPRVTGERTSPPAVRSANNQNRATSISTVNPTPVLVDLTPTPPPPPPPVAAVSRQPHTREVRGGQVGQIIQHGPPAGHSYIDQNSANSTVLGAQTVFHECTVCYEKSVDSVLYMCGHMCMCYECALQQWRGRGGGHCPICRAVIRDVIRTYRS